MATRRQKNNSYQKKKERRNQFWKMFCRVLGIGIPAFILLGYLTYIPVNKPIDPADTVTVTARVTDTRCGEIFIPLRRTNAIELDFLIIHTDQGRFRITGGDDRKSFTEYGNYNILALDEVLQAGDTVTITYRKYYPFLIPGKYVVDLREGEQVYRSLDVHNQKVEGLLLNYGISTAVLIFLILPLTLLVFDVPTAIWSKVMKKRHAQYLADKKAAKEAHTKKGPLV